MRGVIESVTARLASQGVTAYWIEVPDAPTWPYVLLWGSGGRMTTNTLGGDMDDLADRLGVTCVSLSALGVLDLVRITRAALIGWSPTTDALHVQPLGLTDSQDVQPDRDVRLPNSNRHPYFAVDLYRLVGEPQPNPTGGA